MAGGPSGRTPGGAFADPRSADRAPLEAPPGRGEPAAPAGRGQADARDAYHDLFRGLPVGLFRSRANGDVVEANAAALRVLGYPDDFDATTLNSRNLYVDPSERARLIAPIVAGGSPRGAEVRMRRSDGNIVWCHLLTRAVRDDAGQVVGFDGAIIDVTERHLAEERVVRQNRELEALHETAVGLLERLDLADLLDALVSRAAELLATPHGFLYLAESGEGPWVMRVGIGMYTGAVGLHVEQGQGVIGQVFASGTPLLVDDYVEWPGRLPSLDALPIRAVVAVPLVARGAVSGVLGLSSDDPERRFDADDLSLLERFARLASVVLDNARLLGDLQHELVQRREAEAALRQAEERYRTLVEQVPAVIEITSLNEQGTVQFASRDVERVHGYSREEWLADPDLWWRTLHPDDRERLTAEHLGQISDLRPRVVEYRVRHRDGHVVWVRDEAVVIRDADGTPLYVQSVRSDITETKRLEAELLQAQKMEAVGRLAGGIAHDFNNLLTAIGGYARLLADDLGPDDPRHGDAVEIETTAARAAALTRQLLAFARRQVLQPRLLDPNAVVTSMRGLLQRLLGEHIVIELALAPAVGLVRADPSQLEQVVVNLAINARDAMPDGGVLRISSTPVEVTREDAIAGLEPGPHVRFDVADTGAGIAPDVQAHIFEPFFTTKELGSGTGLGLATVHGIFAQSGGAITVASTPGEGATFSIYLPIVEHVAPPAAEETSSHRVRGAGRSVLVVEDEESVRALVTHVLGRNRFEVLAAADAADALELVRARDRPVDVVLTDVVLPGMHGADLVDAMREALPEAAILCMSGYPDDRPRSGTPFVAKPFTPDQLLAAIEAALTDGPGEPDRPASIAGPDA